MARAVLTADLALLAVLDDQIDTAEQHIAELVPQTAYRVLTTGPDWGNLRAGAYAATVGELPAGRPTPSLPGRRAQPVTV